MRSPDDARAVQVVRDVMADGATVEAVYLLLSAPSARRHGPIWESDECDFAEGIIGEFLVRDGWRGRVGAPWSESNLPTMVGTEWFDIVEFSAGSERRLPLLKRGIRRLTSASRTPRVRFMVGGQVFCDDPTIADQVDANALAGDAREAPQIARRLLDAAHCAVHCAASDAPKEALGDHGQFRDALRRE